MKLLETLVDLSLQSRMGQMRIYADKADNSEAVFI